MPSKSKDRKSIAQQSKVFRAVEDDPKLLDLLEIATSTGRKTIFIQTLLETMPTAFAQFINKKPEELFTIFTAWFGSYADSDTIYRGIHAAVQHRQKYFLELRFNKRQFIHDIGLDWTADVRSLFISQVNSVCDLVEKSSFFPRLRLSMFQS